jgi:hypothetical protein
MTRAGYLLHPLAIIGLLLWIANDHVFKAAYPSWWTGKLSDVASLAVFPLIPYAAIDLWRARRGLPPPPIAVLLCWVLATGLVMATINTLDLAATAYRWGLGAAQWPFRALRTWSLLPIHPVRLTVDPTDLLTLPALIVPWLIVCRTRCRPGRASRRHGLTRSEARRAATMERCVGMNEYQSVMAKCGR